MRKTENLDNRLNLDLGVSFTAGRKIILKLMNLQSLVAKRCKMRNAVFYNILPPNFAEAVSLILHFLSSCGGRFCFSCRDTKLVSNANGSFHG